MLPAAMTPRRVLLTLDAVGGVWRHVVDLAGGLRDAGFACRLLGFGPEPDAARIRAEGRRLAGIEMAWTGQPLDWLADRPQALDGIPRLIEREARAWRADLLHLGLPSQAAGIDREWSVLVAAHSCMPTWWRAVRGTSLPDEWRWRRALNLHGFARADAILAPSRSHGEALEAEYGPLPRLAVVPNAHAGAIAASGVKEPFVLAAGRWWDAGKNAAVLDAAAVGTAWPIRLAGPLSGPSGGRCALRHAQALGEAGPEAMRRLMARAAIFAAPSLYEPFGLAVLEAASSGAALLLSDIATFRELWDGAAIFVPPSDADAWRAAIGRLAGDAPARRRLGRLAAERARQFSPDAQLRALAAVYEAVTGADPPVPATAGG